MTIKTWNGSHDPNATWYSAADWFPAGAPESNDDVVIGAGAVVAIPSGGVQPHSVAFTDASASLTGNASISNTTIHAVGNTLNGSFALANDTVAGAVSASSLTFAGSVTFQSGSSLAVTQPGGTLVFNAYSLEGSGSLVLGSPDPASPVSITSSIGAVDIPLTTTITGAVLVQGPAAPVTSQLLLSFGPNSSIAAGGDLILRGNAQAGSNVQIDGGTLDLSDAEPFAAFEGVTFGNQGGTLIDDPFFTNITGFRPGDVLDIPSMQTLGQFAAGANGSFQRFGGPGTTFNDLTTNSTLTAVPDGKGGADVTVSAPTPSVATTDQTTGFAGARALSASTGGPGYLQWQYIDTSADALAMAVSTPDVFLHGGSGMKALQVSSGENVLDGGTGTSFLVGTGPAANSFGPQNTDTFFLDLRGGVPTWDTVVNFHKGDALTVWGYTPGAMGMRLDASDGAPGYAGATYRFISGGGASVSSLTLAGLTQAQASSLVSTTGSIGGTPYLYVYDQGV